MKFRLMKTLLLLVCFDNVAWSAPDQIASDAISTIDALAIINQEARSVRTLDVWYNTKWNSGNFPSSLTHLVWNKVTGAYRVEQYDLKDPTSGVVLTSYTETVLDGKCISLNQSAAKGGTITVGQDGKRHDTGRILSSGKISDDRRKMFVVFQDLFAYPYKESSVFDAIDPKSIKLTTSVTDISESVWDITTPRMELKFSRPKGLFLSVKYLSGGKDSPAHVLSTRTINSYITQNGVSLPKEFRNTYHSPDSPNFQDVTVSLIPELTKINGEVDSEISYPNFPPETSVTDDIQRTSYIVSPLDAIQGSAKTLINTLDDAIQKSEKQKVDANK